MCHNPGRDRPTKYTEIEIIKDTMPYRFKACFKYFVAYVASTIFINQPPTNNMHIKCLVNHETRFVCLAFSSLFFRVVCKRGENCNLSHSVHISNVLL